MDDEHSVFDDENSTLSDKGSRECPATVLQMEMEEISEDNERTSFSTENFGALMDAFGIEYNRYKNVPAVKTRTNPDAKQMLLDDRHHGNQKISVIVNVLLDVVVAASSLILPGDPQFLIEQACDRVATKFCGDAMNKRVSTMEFMTQNLFLICKNMPRNTKAFQIAHAIVMASGSQNNLDQSFANSENIDPPRFSHTAQGTTKDFKAIENGSDPM